MERIGRQPVSGYSQGVACVLFKARFGKLAAHDENPVSPDVFMHAVPWLTTPVLSHARWQAAGCFPGNCNTVNMPFSGNECLLF